jgi:hypothetical protein
MSVKFGAKPIEFEKGKAGIVVPSRDKLPTVIDTLIAAVRAGDGRAVQPGSQGRYRREPPEGRLIVGRRRETSALPPPVPTGTTGSLVCRPCLERDGRVSKVVVEHRCINVRTGKDFTAFICARCMEAGRVTRVTCRTFTPSR